MLRALLTCASLLALAATAARTPQPCLRRHGPARDDWDLSGQAYASAATREALEVLTEGRNAVLASLNTGIHSLE
jgi:hypothetical protein